MLSAWRKYAPPILADFSMLAVVLAHEKIISKFRGTYLRQATLVYFLFPYSCTFKNAELICTELKHFQETATAGGDMLLSKQLKGALAAAK